MQEFSAISYLMSPLIVGLALHGLCLKYGWLRWLGRPIDGGATLRGRRLFGANKTYRGVVAVALGTAVGVGIQAVLYRIGIGRGLALVNYENPAVVSLGFMMGAGAMIAELPNSLLKRQLGIAPGTAARGLVGVLFYVLDQIDLLVGVWAVLWVVVAVTAMRVLWSAVFMLVAHQVVTVVGYGLGMRATVR